MTPLTMLGLVLACWGAMRNLRTQPLWSLVSYVLLYVGVMTIGSHKQDRYLMPVFLAFDILAAMGWVYLWEQMSRRWHKLRTGYSTSVAFAGLLLVQMASVLPYHPYYFPYFNLSWEAGAWGSGRCV